MRTSLRGLLAALYRPLFRIVRPQTGGFRAAILHDIRPDQIAILEKLLDYISAEYGFITPEEAERNLSGHRPSPNTAMPYVLTFDDGFRSSFKVAETVLASRQIRALFFICPGLLDAPAGEQPKLVDYYVFPGGNGRREAAPPLMSWEEATALKTSGHTIGSHSMLHRRLTQLDSHELEDDIVLSARRLRQELGDEPRWFAYPFGDIESASEEVLQVVARHFRFCCSGLRGANPPGVHRSAILRESIDLDAFTTYQRLTIDGGLDFLYRSARTRLQGMVSNIS